MLTFKDFVAKWNNKYCEVVGPSSPNQCFDLVVAWADNLGVPRVNGRSIFPFTYAYQIYTNYGDLHKKYFERIFNDPNAIPKEGDILVWSYYYNYSAGHTAIYHSGDVLRLKAFSQNDPIGRPCILRDYSYSNVLGWLRPKVLPAPVMTDAEIVKAHKDIVNSSISDSEYRNKSRTLLRV